MVIDIEKNKPLFVTEIKVGEKIADIKDKISPEKTYHNYDEGFKEYFSFYEKNLRYCYLKYLNQLKFNVKDWDNSFSELQKEVKPDFKIIFRIKDFFGGYNLNYEFPSLRKARMKSFISSLGIEVHIFNTKTNSIVFVKKVDSEFDFSKTSVFLERQLFNFLTTHYDHSILTQLIIEKSVDDLLADADFIKVLESKSEAQNISFDSEIVLKNALVNPNKNLKKVIESSVTISIGDVHGSGVFVSDDGMILTCNHVLKNNETIDVILNNGIKLSGKVIRKNENFDLALIKVDGVTTNPIKIGDSEKAETGEELFAIGSPSFKDLGQSVSKGILSGKRVIDEKNYIQTDASVSPGNSGGPLINKNFEIIGIVNAKIVGGGSEGIGFAIPSNIILEQLKLKLQ